MTYLILVPKDLVLQCSLILAKAHAEQKINIIRLVERVTEVRQTCAAAREFKELPNMMNTSISLHI